MTDLPRPVWLLGWVSLATDAATEAVYPLLPFFLTRVLRTSAVSLGIIEGAAEAANSLLKILSGRVADRSRTQTAAGAAGLQHLVAVARPFIAVTTTWSRYSRVRVLDRVGKGIRGAPRDAMLAAGRRRRRAERCTAFIAGWITSAPSSARRWRRCSCSSIRIDTASCSR